MSEVVPAAGICRTSVTEAYQTGANPGANNFGCEPPVRQLNRYTASIRTDDDGVITVTTASYTDLSTAASTAISLTPLDSASAKLVIAAGTPPNYRQLEMRSCRSRPDAAEVSSGFLPLSLIARCCTFTRTPG